MNRFIVEVGDATTGEDIHTALYYDDAVEEIGPVVPVRETWEQSNGKPRMTTKQRDKLWELCGSHNVPFREDDYRPTQFSKTSPVMYEGWIGGHEYSHGREGKTTLYVGVEPDGRSHS